MKLIQVRKKRNVVTFMPQHMVDMIDDGALVISIATSDRYRPKFKPNQLVIRVNDEFGDLSIDDLDEVFEVVGWDPGRIVNVHCQSGRIRSKWVAERIAARFPMYEVMAWRPNGMIFEGMDDD